MSRHRFRGHLELPPLPRHAPPPELVVHSIPLVGQPQAAVWLPQPVTEENYQHIRQWLEFMHEALTTDVEESEVDHEQD